MLPEKDYDEGAVKEKFLKLKFAFIIFSIIVSCRLWSFHGLPDQVFNILEVSTAIILLIITINGYKNYDSRAQFKTNVILFILIPILSSFAADAFHGQELYLSFSFFRTYLLWLIYPVLHIYKIPVKWLIKLMIFVGIVWVLLTVVQQFTYPKFYFYTRNGEEEYGGGLFRAGVYRFMLDPKNYALFIIVFFYNRFLISNKIKTLIPVFVGLIGFYYYGTRQYAVAAFICLFLASIMQTGTKRVYALFFITIIIFFLLYFNEVLFQGYIEMTNAQLHSNDDIRLLSAKFFLIEYWPHWITYITGNGQEHINSSYGKEMINLNQTLGFYRGDVGIIGAFNKFGILYVINIISLNLKGIRKKYYSKETMYLKLLFFNFILLLPLSEEYSYASSIPFFCIIFYLVDQSYCELQ